MLILVLVTELPLLQQIFETESLSAQQWGLCLVAAMLFLLAGEIARLILRLVLRRSGQTEIQPSRCNALRKCVAPWRIVTRGQAHGKGDSKRRVP